MAVILDLDQTLIDSRIALAFRDARRWQRVYPLIPKFQPYDGILTLLHDLVAWKIPLAIVTSSPGTYCQRVVEAHGFPITHFVCYHDTVRKKPHPEPTLKALERLGVPAAAAVAIGDDPKDILSARAASVFSVAATWGTSDPATLRASGADLVVETCSELRVFLQERFGTAASR
ncbi:MAG: Phosphoglycolate phosphatase [Phycisphaerae bacterium]|nr:Phosphoglycolate phosphatase [Phycisphaerae bacterium]